MNRALCFDDVLLVPRHNPVESRDQVDTSTEFGDLTMDIPIWAANMPTVTGISMVKALATLGGGAILPRPLDLDAMRTTALEGSTGISIGLSDEDLAQAKYAIGNWDMTVCCIDIAHAHTSRAKVLLYRLLDEIPNSKVIVGNIATPEAARFLLRSAAPHLYKRIALKIGVGSGAACSTRIHTGHGLPTLQSVLDIAKALEGTPMEPVHLIADGGMKTSGDIVKALAAGAHSVMLGSLLAGTTESPPPIISAPNGLVKRYSGNASAEGKKYTERADRYIEGVSKDIPYKGAVTPIVNSLMEGVRSGFTYSGAQNLPELHRDARFVEVSNAGHTESAPHI